MLSNIAIPFLASPRPLFRFIFVIDENWKFIEIKFMTQNIIHRLNLYTHFIIHLILSLKWCLLHKWTLMRSKLDLNPTGNSTKFFVFRFFAWIHTIKHPSMLIHNWNVAIEINFCFCFWKIIIWMMRPNEPLFGWSIHCWQVQKSFFFYFWDIKEPHNLSPRNRINVLSN